MFMAKPPLHRLTLVFRSRRRVFIYTLTKFSLFRVCVKKQKKFNCGEDFGQGWQANKYFTNGGVKFHLPNFIKVDWLLKGPLKFSFQFRRLIFSIPDITFLFYVVILFFLFPNLYILYKRKPKRIYQ